MRSERKPKALRPVSKKMAGKLPEYRRLKQKLIILSGNKSELDGSLPDWRGLEVHHVMGRIGKRLADPLNLIVLTASQHEYEQSHMTPERKTFLLALIRPIRVRQGYKE